MILSQSYYNTPKIIRQNVNYVVILKLGGTRDINSLLREVSIGLSKEQLLEMNKKATKIKFDVMILYLEKSGKITLQKKNFTIF